ncbi:ornithine decarboxylase 1-like [Engraulis encrasicolus]|uniref:ornithine decarboxylase 1-like n=1 Tax=Engraulis encrasicolus TaxID=184585 RepID=UPI002FD27052
MNTFTCADFNFTILEEGGSAKDAVEQIISKLSMSGGDDAFFVADLGDVVRKHLRWTRALPRVQPYYAVKCNPSRAVVMALAALGAGFDCASKAEIQLVQSVGVSSERIIYANPCKQLSHLQYALQHGAHTMTFDNEEELLKIARCHGNAKLVLRITTDDSTALISLSVKFGAPLRKCRVLLERARQLSLEVVGVSFHVGSGCTDPKTYSQAIADAHHVFQLGAELGFNMRLLDIGGGYPGTEHAKLKFEECVAVINPALDRYFPAGSGVKVIAEPGCYFVASAYTLAVNVIAKNEVLVEEPHTGEGDTGSGDRTLMYYVNDGVYGSFNGSFKDGSHIPPTLLKSPEQGAQWLPCSVWGQTCDGIDRIVEHTTLPELQVGDWLLFENMGAYTVAASSNFNGFQSPDVHYVISRAAW